MFRALDWGSGETDVFLDAHLRETLKLPPRIDSHRVVASLILPSLVAPQLGDEGCMASSSSEPNAKRQPPAFAAELQGLPVVAAATFCGGECCNVVREGRVPLQSGAAAEAVKTSEASVGQKDDDPQLLSKSLAAAEKAAVAFLAAAAKASAGGKAEEADTLGNDELGLDDD
ncbi:hypothetical protein Esti_000133 [Eimeria stiedai]